MTLPRTLFLAVSTSLCLQMGGCAAHEAARAIAEDAGPTGPEPSTAPPGPPAETSAIRVSAAYPATLFYALDAAAGVRNRDPGYRAWIYDGDEVPAWLEAYSARRRTWTARIDDSGGGSLAIERCARDAIHLDAAITCIEKVIPAADRGVLRTAVEKADSRVAPHHRRAAPHLETMLGAMRDGLASRDATELLRLLRDVDRAGLRRLRDEGKLSGGMLPKVAAIERALSGGVPRVHVISYAQADSLLLEVFTNEGTGTLVVNDTKALRPEEQAS